MTFQHASQASVVINKPIAEVFALLNDLGQLADWTPFVKMDPSMTHSVNDVRTGVGAVYSWNGKRIGKGTQTIVALTEPTEIHSKMTFGEKATADTSYILTPVSEGTSVAWVMSGDRSLGDQILGFLFLDKMMSKNFADGLAALKGLLESR
jgi:uncharacterized protein YndB with AHSA1/START domain